MTSFFFSGDSTVFTDIVNSWGYLIPQLFCPLLGTSFDLKHFVKVETLHNFLHIIPATGYLDLELSPPMRSLNTSNIPLRLHYQ